VKDQYFGDVNDFRKYGLLRQLTASDRLRLGVCWMLTEPDDGTDGGFLQYLQRPEKYRHYDPELFDWLQQVAVAEQDHRTARLEVSNLFGPAVFKSEVLTDCHGNRADYFAACANCFAGCDLVFFDPDNGLEIKSIRRGRMNSCKFLYWDEVCGLYTGGSSVLVYQHFIREKRDAFTARMAGELHRRLSPAAVFSFSTPNVLFLLASHEGHAGGFRRQLRCIEAFWPRSEITTREHTFPNASDRQHEEGDAHSATSICAPHD
jgi:hypothetical protein